MAYKKIGSGEPFKMGNSEKGKLWLWNQFWLHITIIQQSVSFNISKRYMPSPNRKKMFFHTNQKLIRHCETGNCGFNCFFCYNFPGIGIFIYRHGEKQCKIFGWRPSEKNSDLGFITISWKSARDFANLTHARFRESFRSETERKTDQKNSDPFFKENLISECIHFTVCFQ